MKDKSSFVNGPVNVIRLEKNINGINKVLYTFMDYHLPVQEQTKCDNIRSKDITEYLTENFDKISESNEIYDFFFENAPTLINEPVNNLKKKYIWEMNDFFLKSFLIDKSKNVVTKSNTFPNIRFHYADIRDYMVNHDLIYQLDSIVDNIIYNNKITRNDVFDITDLVSIGVAEMKELYNILFSIKRKKPADHRPAIPVSKQEQMMTYTKEDMKKMIENFIDKIKYEYKHTDIKNIINNIINTDVKEMFTKYFDHSKKYLELMDQLFVFTADNHNKLQVDEHIGVIYNNPKYVILEKLAKLSLTNNIYGELKMRIISIITDIFFLRRFLEKDYVMNGISYTGALHSIQYIYILVKYFDFKITHYSYVKETNLDKLHKEIKKANSFSNIDVYFSKPNLVQCSDMTNFPKLFK